MIYSCARCLNFGKMSKIESRSNVHFIKTNLPSDHNVRNVAVWIYSCHYEVLFSLKTIIVGNRIYEFYSCKPSERSKRGFQITSPVYKLIHTHTENN